MEYLRPSASMNFPPPPQPEEDPVLGWFLETVIQLPLQTGETELARFAAAEIHRHLGVDRVSVWLCDPDHVGISGTCLVDETGQTHDESPLYHSFADMGGLPLAGEKSRPAYLQDDSTTPLNSPFLKSLGTGRKLVVAIWDGQKNLGFIACGNLPTKHPFTPFQIKSVRLLSLVLGRILSTRRNPQPGTGPKQDLPRWEKRLPAGQRPEGFGTLAAGLAHDFNNMLTGILGNTSLALLKLPPNTPAYNDLLKAEAIIHQAAEYCGKLQAFAGQNTPGEVRPAAASPTALPDARTGTQVLVVDDEASIRSLASRILTRVGYQVRTAEDGAAALEIYEKEKNTLRLILLDLTMPRLDGHQVIREIRKTDPHIPILIMSGYSELELAHKFEGHAPNGFIQKPFHIPNLLEKISSILT